MLTSGVAVRQMPPDATRSVLAKALAGSGAWHVVVSSLLSRLRGWRALGPEQLAKNVQPDSGNPCAPNSRSVSSPGDCERSPRGRVRHRRLRPLQFLSHQPVELSLRQTRK